MYKIETTVEFEAAHKLDLDYDSPCKNLHGHSYKCSITIENSTLDDNGMICDFKILKQIVKERVEDRLDHKNLNDVFTVNATAEYMARWICEEVNWGLQEKGIRARCMRVALNETSKNKAIWEVM